MSDGLDWRGLADAETTLIVDMGGRTAGMLADRLIAEGLAPGTPACAVAAVGRPAGARWTGPLTGLGQGGAGLGVGQPVLIGLGRVFAPIAVPAASASSHGCQ